jgi:hypothetical protein
LAGIYVLGRPRKLFPARPRQSSLARPASRPVVTPAGPLLFAPGWAAAVYPAGPGNLPLAGPQSAFPGWAGVPTTFGPSRRPASIPGWARWPGLSPYPAGPLATYLAGPAPRPPAGPGRLRLGSFLQLPRGPSSPRPGWAGSGGSGLAGIPSRPPFANSGWAGLEHSGWARPALPWPRPDYLHGRLNYPSPGRDLLPPGHIPRPASTPAPCASPGTPLGSDWHILHRHMLVLGCSLAQTSILPSPSQSYP